jgi:hypothetical protein
VLSAVKPVAWADRVACESRPQKISIELRM